MTISEEILSLLETQKVEFEGQLKELKEEMEETDRLIEETNRCKEEERKKEQKQMSKWKEEREEADKEMGQKFQQFLDEREGLRYRSTHGGVLLPVNASLQEDESECISSVMETEVIPSATELVAPIRLTRIKSFTSTMTRMLGLGRFSTMTGNNTETLSMHAVAVVIDKDASIVRKLLHSLGVLLFVSLQVYLLYLVMNEATHKKCNSMADCYSGTYCASNNGNTIPFCVDCSEFGNFPQAQEVCPDEFPTGEWETMGDADIDHIDLLIKKNIKSNKHKCLSFRHCSQTDMDAENEFDGHCDFVYLNTNKMDGGTLMMIIFLGFLWALPISQDIEEAATEERVMDHHLDGSLNIPAEIVRLVLRIRRCYVPFAATSATLVLLITDDISAKNIILNFLAVTFISEADNVLAVLLLGAPQRELMENAVAVFDSENLNKSKAAFFWFRLQGLFCVLVLIVGLLQIDKWVKNCNALTYFLTYMAFFPSMIVIVGQGFYMACVKRDEEPKCTRILSALLEFCRNISAIFIEMTVGSVLFYFLNGDLAALDALKDLFVMPTIAFLLITIGLELCKRMRCARNRE